MPPAKPTDPHRHYSGLILPFGEQPTGGLNLPVFVADRPSMRRIPPPRPLDESKVQGIAAEDATSDAATIWGLPDFFFRSTIRRKGKGVRELGDRLLITDDRAVMIQVKSRTSVSDNPIRERSWIERRVRHGFSQGRGSVRELCRQPASAINHRGSARTIQGETFDWTLLVIVDHPDPPSCSPPVPENGVAMLRRDWEFLFDQLKSSTAVVNYLFRLAGEAIPLGSESTRYYEFASADEDADDSPADLNFSASEPTPISAPILPMKPVGFSDFSEQETYRLILEDAAKLSNRSLEGEDHYDLISSLDGLHHEAKKIVGGFVLDRFEDVFGQADGILWDFKKFNYGRTVQLAFGLCSEAHSQEIQGCFSAWVTLRHHEFTSRFEDVGDELMTVGVLLTPCVRSRSRPWDTTLCAERGELGLTEDDIKHLVELWKSESSLMARVAPGQTSDLSRLLWTPGRDAA